MSTEEMQRLAEYRYWKGVSYLQGGDAGLAMEVFDEFLGDFKGHDCVSYEIYAGLAYNYRQIADNMQDSEEKQTVYLKAAEAFDRAEAIIGGSSGDLF